MIGFMRAHRVISKSLSALALISFCAAVVPIAARCGDAEETIYHKWREVNALQLRGDFDDALRLLNGIIEEHADSAEILKTAHNHLVNTYVQMGDRAAAREEARHALERFPDIEADIVVFPSFVNDIYEQLRNEMYGSLSITDPEGCSVFLNGNHIGDTPLKLSLVRAREYKLVVSKPGYHEYTDSIRINPSEKHNFTVSMKSQRNKRWWLYRISPVVLSLIIGGIVYSQISGDGGEPAPEPLPGPPPPPAW